MRVEGLITLIQGDREWKEDSKIPARVAGRALEMHEREFVTGEDVEGHLAGSVERANSSSQGCESEFLFGCRDDLKY